MATIRLKEWTKERVDAILDEEDHSSHDSVVKSLLKDREYAEAHREENPAGDEFAVQPDLAVFDDLDRVEDGRLSLWCPNCAGSVGDVLTETGLPIDRIELECPNCRVELGPMGLVATSMAYPADRLEAEGRDDRLEEFRETVVSYWHRVLEKDWSHLNDEYTDVDRAYADDIHDQYREFDRWDWPDEVPVVTLERGRTYSVGPGSLTSSPETWHVERVERGVRNWTFVVERVRDSGGTEEVETDELSWDDVREDVLSRRIRVEGSEASDDDA